MDALGNAQPRILYLATEDWAFFQHRLPMALAAQRAGYQVHVGARANDKVAAIESLGFTFHALPFRRGSLNPLHALGSIAAVRRLYQAIAPDLVHNVALQPSVFGMLAALGKPVAQLSTMTGLGFVFTSRSWRAALVNRVLKSLLPWLINRRRNVVTVENPDDRAALVELGIAPDRVQLIPGSGVDSEAMRPLPEPAGPFTAAFVGRLLDDKGIRTLMDAHALLLQRGVKVRLLVAGTADPANPTSIPADEIAEWKTRDGVELLGHVGDIRTVWARAHIAVLPSRREGLPVSLLEAAACGRAIVATDVPGCREIARAGVNALLVPPDDAPPLAAAIEKLAREPETRAKFAAAGRVLVETEFSAARVGAITITIYDRLLGRAGTASV